MAGWLPSLTFALARSTAPMLSNKDTAREVEKMMQQCSTILNDSILNVMETCPEEEFKAYRVVVARIMADIYLNVKQPIQRRHPDLEPDQIRDE
jgi:hypothetical protein